MHYPKAQTVSLIKVAVSMILAIVAVFMSFTTIFTIDFSDSDLYDSFYETYEYLADEIGGIEIDEDEIPETVDITAAKLVSVGKAMTKLTSVIVSAISDSSDTEDYEDAVDDLENFISSKEGQTAIITAIALASQIIDTSMLSDDEEAETALASILFMVIKMFALMVICLGTLFMMIMLIICFVIDVIRILTHLKDLGSVSGKVCKIFNIPLRICVMAILLMTLLGGVTAGSAIIVTLVLALVNVICTMICTRLRKYNKSDLRYINIVQGTAAAEAVGAITFFVCVQQTGILRKFINSLSSYLVEMVANVADINATLKLAKQTTMDAPVSYLIDTLLIIAAALLVLTFFTMAIKVIPARLGLTSRRRATGLSVGILGLIIPILPMVVAKMEHAVLYELDYSSSGKLVTSETTSNILNITSSMQSALTGMIIGAVIIIVAAIASKVLIGMFCRDIDPEIEKEILSGDAPEPVSETAAVSEEASEGAKDDKATK